MNSHARCLSLCLLLCLAGCGPKSSADAERSASAFLAAEKYAEAAIEAKAALQFEPNSARFRYLLGAALARSGNAVMAEVELRKAMALHYPLAEVAPELVISLREQFRFQKIIDEFEKLKIDDPAAAAVVQVAVATSYAKLGNRDAANRILQGILGKQPALTDAAILQARLQIGTPEMPAAKAALEALTVREPRNAEVWLALGDLRLFRGSDLGGAVEAFRKAIEIRPKASIAYAAVGAILISQRKLDAAEHHLKAMKEALPGNPETVSMEANLALVNKDYARARGLYQQLLRVYSKNTKLLQLAAATEINLGGTQQAETYLRQALQITPGLAPARRMLAKIYLRSGQVPKALDVLQPLLAGERNDPAALMLAAEASLQTGDLKMAEERFRVAQLATPGDVQIGVGLALTELAKGHEIQGLSQLETLAAADTGTAADMALISSRLRLGQFPAALQAVEALGNKQPDKPEPANLKGRILLQTGDKEGARKSFEQALLKDRRYFPAVASLAAMDMTEKRPEVARQRFDELLKLDNRHRQARFAIAELLIRTSAPKDEVLRSLNDAIRADPTEARPRVVLINYLTGLHDLKAALVAAQEGVTTLPSDTDLLDALGGVFLLSGEFNQALATFQKVATLLPKVAQPHLRLADVYQAKGDTPSAIKSIRRALEVEPANFAAQRNLIALYRKGKQLSEAYQTALNLQKAFPASAAGYAFEGDIAADLKDWSRAANAFRAGLVKSGGAELATRVHGALVRSGKAAEANTFGREWVKKNPDDLRFLMYSGDKALEANDLALALVRYQQVMEQDPKNVFALNNAAWVMAKQSKPGAVKLAEDAVALLPESPVLLDTLAFALAQTGRWDKAIEAEKKAIAAGPKTPAYRVNLAKLYIKSGNKPAAIAELEKLSTEPLDANIRQGIGKLLQSLK